MRGTILTEQAKATVQFSTWTIQHTSILLTFGAVFMLQMSELKEVDSALRKEYTVRRRMLIERAKVTLQSFMWAERLEKEEGMRGRAQAAAKKGEALMQDEPAVSLDDVFRAKQGQALPLVCNVFIRCFQTQLQRCRSDFSKEAAQAAAQQGKALVHNQAC